MSFCQALVQIFYSVGAPLWCKVAASFWCFRFLTLFNMDKALIFIDK